MADGAGAGATAAATGSGGGGDATVCWLAPETVSPRAACCAGASEFSIAFTMPSACGDGAGAAASLVLPPASTDSDSAVHCAVFMLHGRPVCRSMPQALMQLKPVQLDTALTSWPLKYQALSDAPSVVPSDSRSTNVDWPDRQCTRQVGENTPLPCGSDAMRASVPV